MIFRHALPRTVLLLAGFGALLLLAACAPPELPAAPATAETPVAPAATSPSEPTSTPIHPTLPPPSIPEKKVTPVRKLPLIDTTWQLESYPINGVSQQALPDHPATLTLQDGKFSGNTGCNGLSGTYTIQGDAIHFELGPMTMRACLEEVADQEAAYLAGLKQAAAYRIEGGKLMLFDDQGDLLLTFSQQTPISLTDGSWQLLSFNNGQGGMESNLATERITARFTEDGQLSGNAGCNHYATSYQIDGEKLTVGKIASTQMFCNDPEGVMETENVYLKNLANAASFRIEGDRLTIFDSEGKKLLVFRHVAGPDLTDVTWQLVSMGADNETPVASVASRVQVTFSEDGRVAGNAGCNSFKGNYRVDGDQIEIGPLATTRKMCEQNVMTVERTVLQGMEQATSFEIKDGQLTLLDETGSPLLTFTPAP